MLVCVGLLGRNYVLLIARTSSFSSNLFILFSEQSVYCNSYWIEGEQKKDEVVIRLYYIYWLMITNYLPLLHGRIVLQLLDLLVKVWYLHLKVPLNLLLIINRVLCVNKQSLTLDILFSEILSVAASFLMILVPATVKWINVLSSFNYNSCTILASLLDVLLIIVVLFISIIHYRCIVSNCVMLASITFT